MKRVIGISLALAAVLALSTRFLPGAFEVTEAGEAFPITLVGSDIAYDTLTGNHNDLKALGIMDPNATVWTEPAVTKDDLGEFLGSVGWSPEEELIGCSMYRWARFPQVKEVCVLDQGGEYHLYQERGTYHAPNGTGIPVTEVEEEVLSAPGILREDFEQPTDAREVLLDIGGDGEEERLVIGKEGSFLYVVEEGKTWELPGKAFLWEIEQRLELEQTEDRTTVALGERLTNPTALLKEKGVSEVTEAGFPSIYTIHDGSKAGWIRLGEEVQLRGRQKNVGILLTVAEFSGRIGYENGIFTLSDWVLSGLPLP